jgi:predicted nucleotidyltransferase
MKAHLRSRLETNECEAIHAYVTCIERQFPDQLLDVVLFGSKARGDAAEESDIDLLVLMDEENDVVRAELWRIASDVSLEYDVVLSVRVYGRARWDESRRIRLPLYRAIVDDGIPLISERMHLSPSP